MLVSGGGCGGLREWILGRGSLLLSSSLPGHGGFPRLGQSRFFQENCVVTFTSSSPVYFLLVCCNI